MAKLRKGAVGYGKPPSEYQWKPGQSGNPRGRRKKSLPLDISESLVDALLADQRVQMDGRETLVPRYVLFAESLVRDSLRAPLSERLKVFRQLEKAGVLKQLHDRISCQREEEQERASDEWCEEAKIVMARVKRALPGLFEDTQAPDLSDRPERRS